MIRYRIDTAFANRQREFTTEREARDYARALLRLDPRLAHVRLVEIEERVTLIGREQKGEAA